MENLKININKENSIEIRDSISNLKNQCICVELYAYNYIGLNKRLGYAKKGIY
jgi:hypothetical protein